MLKPTLAVIWISTLFSIQQLMSLSSNNQFHFQHNVVKFIIEVYAKFLTDSFSYLTLSLVLSLQFNVRKRPKLILKFHQRVDYIKLEQKRKYGLGYIWIEGNYILTDVQW
jgi:hypothetical protein